MSLSERVNAIKPSATVAISSKALQLKHEGVDVIALSTGEPDFDTPDFVKEAAIQAIHEGKTKYTQVDGTPELKEALINKFKRENDLNFEANQIIVSNGGKHSLYNLYQALLNPGDEVVILAPYWVSYPAMSTLADAKSVIVKPKEGLKVTALEIRQAITDKTKLLILNSPSNPSGEIYSEEELTEIADMLMEFPHVFIATDDIYEHINWSGQAFKNILNAKPALAERTIVINGVAKAYAMTGWRIGYAAGPAPIINAMKKIQSQSTSNPCSISQAASVAALNGDQSFLKGWVAEYKTRHDYIFNRIKEINGLSFDGSVAAFYAFVNVTEACQHLKLADDVAFADYLLDNAQVAVVPGTAFGMEGYVRISFATSMENLEKACQRIEDALTA